MKEPPILFSVPMVCALLDGRKTQTRRVLDGRADAPPAYVEGGVITALDERDRPYRWPHTHAVGDLLWVREPWWTDQDADWIPPSDVARHAPIYRQTDPKPADAGRYRQARFMCRLPGAYSRGLRFADTFPGAFLNLLILAVVFVGPLALAFSAGVLTR